MLGVVSLDVFAIFTNLTVSPQKFLSKTLSTDDYFIPLFSAASTERWSPLQGVHFMHFELEEKTSATIVIVVQQ